MRDHFIVSVVYFVGKGVHHSAQRTTTQEEVKHYFISGSQAQKAVPHEAHSDDCWPQCTCCARADRGFSCLAPTPWLPCSRSEPELYPGRPGPTIDGPGPGHSLSIEGD